MKKIVCISKEVFRKLKAAWKKFELKQESRPQAPFCQKPPKKERLEGPRNGDCKADTDKCIRAFEPSNIVYTRASYFWRLINLESWFKEQASYEDPGYLNTYKRQKSNEKRHILV